ncbi:hypothetical protein HHK36_002291 [Tetracentron sinense]|uniref:BZIP domain-containing protein n=1 Tax=Tetracentron sinense TaxID=13715 RepID=A0A835DVJ1_TETSI|nr:hypothetical protein HHK36_002291 [Tetracentron sinense]
MFPLYPTYEDETKPLQFCMPPLGMGLQGVTQFQTPILVQNLIKPANYPLGEALADFENYNEIQSNGMRTKRQTSIDETQFFVGDGSGSNQFQLNVIGSVTEPVRTAGLGVGNRGVCFFPNYQYQLVNGFTVGCADEVSTQRQVGENLMDAAAERRRRRMIKNRESAARSRARRQAYNAQLLLEIKKLKKENEVVRKVLQILLSITRMEHIKIRSGLLRTFSAPS